MPRFLAREGGSGSEEGVNQIKVFLRGETFQREGFSGFLSKAGENPIS
jgi:hypothetical protein